MPFQIEPLLNVAVKAGRAILEIYNDATADMLVEYKQDASPLTRADQVSHTIITTALSALYPRIPILSEEGADVPYDVRKGWDTYWCIDPLDGTKEFINRNGEFTVNIALMQKSKPVLGIIYIPVQDVLYYGDAQGSFKRNPGAAAAPIKIDPRQQDWVSVGSRSHADSDEHGYLKKFPVAVQKSAGSSLKFCLIAEGEAHIYYRKGPTMEWDTAAGQAIVEHSGGLVETEAGAPLRYNKPSLRNESFICRIPFSGAAAL